MLAMDDRSPDSFVALGPRYPWGGLYGGQIVAQALRAASATVEPAFAVHSLHSYFIRRGDADEPIRFDVDRLRNGRNFVTRAVVARQSRGAILHMSASFSRSSVLDPPREGAPSAPGPEAVTDDSWSPMFDRRYVTEAADRIQAWFRLPDLTADDQIAAACGLAYVSDDLASDAVRNMRQALDGQPVGTGAARLWDGVSLDHAIWFHRPVSGDAWQLHEFCCEGLSGERGLAVGKVFSPAGAHLATVAQEVLLRPAGPDA
jgi:acyl-CoA thioesterase-2